jgi:hypothetical protein
MHIKLREVYGTQSGRQLFNSPHSKCSTTYFSWENILEDEAENNHLHLLAHFD